VGLNAILRAFQLMKNLRPPESHTCSRGLKRNYRANDKREIRQSNEKPRLPLVAHLTGSRGLIWNGDDVKGADSGKQRKNPDCLALSSRGSKQEILNLIFGKPTSLK
jgi:hypothetical protein